MEMRQGELERAAMHVLAAKAGAWADSHGIRALFIGADADHVSGFDIYHRLGYRPLAARLEVAKVLSADEQGV
jgi:hypothetical protein